MNRSFFYCCALLCWLCLAQPLFGQPTPDSANDSSFSTQFKAKIAELWNQLPKPQIHSQAASGVEQDRRRAGESYQAFLREKMAGQWFAVLLSAAPDKMFAIERRFGSWKELMDFLLADDALVEVWAYPENGAKARRIPATEMASLKQQRPEQPTFITVTWRDNATGKLATNRVEFGFKAAGEVFAASAGYKRQREMQTAARAVLGARDAHGRFNAIAQWEELARAAQAGSLPLAEMPPRPSAASDLLVAFEYELDAFNNYSRIARVYRESEIHHAIRQVSPAQSEQVLVLSQNQRPAVAEVRTFHYAERSGRLEPALNAVSGQDVIELRVSNPHEPDVRKWNVLEFGEPELARESALAKFSLISAYLEKKRKEIALKKSRIDLIAEPIFAGLNIGGGVAAVGFPIGEAARLGYNAAVVPWFIPDVPTAKEMRELFRLMTARSQQPELKTKPSHFLDENDFKKLQESAKTLTDAQVLEYLQEISDDDLKGMIRLARMQRIDAKVVNLLSIIAGAAKVSGWSDSAGFQREAFNSIYFSVTAEVSLSFIVATLAGGEIATPKNGYSLETLSGGRGPWTAWLQYMNLTVDLRAVANTLARLSHRSLADKELKKPFPYGPRLSDLSAYELRVFGFPLLLFYKRGLLKDDYASYLNDYAYGLIGATIVEHFHTREEMDAEIRAGRMVPLGYVRLPDGKGGWKETNLAVFAHRIPAGKNKGKTSVIIYGLKAYSEQSRAIEREYLRLKKFDQALREGGVIERVVEADDRALMPSEEFEPKIYAGPENSANIYAPLLGGLQELHRYWQRKSWRVPTDTNDVDLIGGILERFAAENIWLEDGDPLVWVDPYSSSFGYRRSIGGKSRTIQWTLLPAPGEIEREVSKAKEGAQLDQMRQQALSDQGDGLIFLNNATRIGDKYEIGPLLQNERGEVIGFGARSGSKAIEEIFDKINQLPVADRARLHFNHFTATLLPLDLDATGKTQNVFLTIEFPPQKKIRRSWTNPQSGEREFLQFENGRLVASATERRLTQIDYGQGGQELASRTYYNSGNAQHPVQGALLEETRTLEVWTRDLGGPDIDPYQPLLSKLKINHVTGEIAREVYGLFPFPVSRVDDQFITTNQFNAYGIFQSARVLDNGISEGDAERPLLQKLLAPVPGQLRFALTSVIPAQQLAADNNLRNFQYQTLVERRDLLKGLGKRILLDIAHWGRKASESYVDNFDGTASFSVSATNEYRDDFYFGFLPVKTRFKSVPGGAVLSEIEFRTCDPVTRRVTGVEVQSTGHTLTKVWDYRWENPIEVESTLKRTTNQFDRFDTSVSGATLSKASGEPIAEFSARYDPLERNWHLNRTVLHRPAIPKRKELETLSGFGKLISTRFGDLFECHPIYNGDGLETGRRTTRTNLLTGQFDLVCRLEDDYKWNQGERDSRNEEYVDGKAYDSFRTVADSEGRMVIDQIRRFPGCDLKTLIAYDGASERVISAVELQNGQTRARHVCQVEQKQADGSWSLPVAMVPSWGLASTQTFRIGDILARPIATTYANGDLVTVTEWYQGTSIPRVSVIKDRHGWARERFIKKLNQGTDNGVPFDSTERYRLGFWGAPGLAEEEACIRGTAVALFKRTAEEKIYYDLDQPFAAPWYAVDPDGQTGMAVTLKQMRKAHVLGVCSSRLTQAGDSIPARRDQAAGEPQLALDAIDLRGLFYHAVNHQLLDVSGKILEEKFGRIPNLGDTNYTERSLAEAMRGMKAAKKFHYRYEPGWWVEEVAREGTGRSLLFTNKQPAPNQKCFSVNDSAWREFVTRIDGVQATSESASEQDLDEGGPKTYFFRRMHSPRWLERNPYMPDHSSSFLAWAGAELNPEGQTLYTSENIFDAAGRLCVAVSRKTTDAGEPAFKTAYQLCPPVPGMLRERRFSDDAGALKSQVSNLKSNIVEPTLLLEQNSRSNFSSADFLYFYWSSESNRLTTIVLTDASGQFVRVGQTDPDYRRHLISRWPLSSAQVRWLPDSILPAQAAVVIAPAGLLQNENVIAISVHDLARAGLDLSHVRSAQVQFENRHPVLLSSLCSLSRDGPCLPDWTRSESSYQTQLHSGGLKTFAAAPRDRTEREIYGGQGQSAVSEFNGLPTFISRPRAAHSEYPEIIAVDNSDSDASRPLYALSPKEGHLLEYYKLRKTGDAQVFTIVQGFDLPRMEVFNARVLGDEVAPGFIAYGSDYGIRTKYTKGRGVLGHALASLHNRIAANAFEVGGERLKMFGYAVDPATRIESHALYSSLQDAHRQAEEINHLPILAQALLTRRELPWKNTQTVATAVLTQDWSRLRFMLFTNLDELHLRYPSGLIPTSPDTATERYVDTVQEAGLIRLATKLGEAGLAGALLEFYLQKSKNGLEMLHSTYDAEAGTAKMAELISERPRHAPRTAEAQLAIADAAFGLGWQTGDSQWLSLGRNLTDLVLTKFRAPAGASPGPQGICESSFVPLLRRYGLTRWPEAQRFTLRSNARAYLLLKQLKEVLERSSSDNSWRQQITEAAREQEAWLKTNILPHVERTGVVPMGLFEIQDVNRETTALAVEPSTSAEDWLAFLEAADAMGLPQEQLRRWLENLARVHGVRIQNAWGLDWSTPILRPDAISTQATAWFERMAIQLGSEEAAQFAHQNLKSLQDGMPFPVVLTEADPKRALQSGRGFFISPLTNHHGWPATLSPYSARIGPGWNIATVKGPLDLAARSVDQLTLPRTDRTVFIWITGGFYFFILLSALFWWRFRALRRSDRATVFPDPLVPEPVLQRAEERWAKRVLGAQTPDGAGKTRYSNAPLEQNFLLQLKAIYKLILEWRRQENVWEEDDPRLVNDEQDSWLNGLDEFAVLAGLYLRWVIKAGAKDGFRKADVMVENEDSNQIWARLVMFFSEYYWGLLSLMRNYNNLVTQQDKANLQGQMSQLLSSLGLRQRPEGFDARKLFDFPADPEAMDLLAVQQPGMTLDKLAMEASRKLRIPYLQIVRFVERYKEFKRREDPYPIHPYLIEFAKVMPHFLLMGLGALIAYNQKMGDSPIVPYLGSVLAKLALSPGSLLWAVPLLGSLALSIAAHLVKVYRFEAPLLARERTDLFLDATLTSLFAKPHSVMPKGKTGKWWSPSRYEWAGWALRACGFLCLGVSLLKLEAPSFATFLVVKGLLAMLAFAEVAAVLLPLAASAASRFLQDYVTQRPSSGALAGFLNRLNLTVTRPASPLWLSIKYHTAPSVPTGTFLGMAQAMVFYFVLAAAFFFIGGFLCQQIFSLWFTDTYLKAADWKLFFGGLLFWNTMYLLRYGLFLLFTGIASLLASFPIKGTLALLALMHLFGVFFQPALPIDLRLHPTAMYSPCAVGLVLILLEQQIRAAVKRILPLRSRKDQEAQTRIRFEQIKQDRTATLGVVYMSGDDLGYQKLTPQLLMTRWGILRQRLNSFGGSLLSRLASVPNDDALQKAFQDLYDAENKANVTLWHPMQIVLPGEAPPFPAELRLTVRAESGEQRAKLLNAWHIRRWLVSMMSTAGHSQDTGINLVDMALRLKEEGLGANVAFYLIQNKYDNSEHNRPSQTRYDTGELNQRNKLAHLLEAVLPGACAYNLQDWTPFGFKAGAMTGMDLVHEHSLKLTTMLVLDRNATIHDLDALMADLTQALTDPGLVIIIPGRGTTNTLTPVGQGSQMVEEGHRSFLKGLMALLGGNASEALGTGWGNILAVSYGSVQRAMVDAHTARMPLTSRMQRGSSFAVRAEGLIGFAPHAVGISEDTWAVSQATHNAIALGRRVKFMLSRGMWHKIRETWSHSEWLASFPRWSGGYLQMMHDPLMQRINDFGALSVFAKEVRANSGRNFLSAPFALLSILFMPLAIMLDITPFVQILILLWNFGFVMNQILTAHALNTYLESSGFYRWPALLGAGIAGVLPLFRAELAPFAPGLILLGCLAGGFWVGLSRWLYTRVRDLILFGPQLVLHALGQVVRQSLEFVVSGASPEDAKGVNMAFRAWAGPREDRPLDGFPNVINLKTVIWVVGLFSVILNLFALSNLDMLNVLLLLPSLLFSVSTLTGPFILSPRAGKPLGKWVIVPKLLGWMAAFAFFTVVSMMVAAGGWLNWLGFILFCLLWGGLLWRGLQFGLFRYKLNRAKRYLNTLLALAEVAESDRSRLGQLLLQEAGRKAPQLPPDLATASTQDQETLLKFVRERLQPLLKAPAPQQEKTLTTGMRWRSEFGRALVLSLFVLLWFFIVPVPGLLVFTTDEYRFLLSLGTIFRVVLGTVGFIVAASWTGRLIQWLDRRGLGNIGLSNRTEQAYKNFLARLAAPGTLAAPMVASTFALFTDLQIYMDQESYAYARKALGKIENKLQAEQR